MGPRGIPFLSLDRAGAGCSQSLMPEKAGEKSRDIPSPHSPITPRQASEKAAEQCYSIRSDCMLRATADARALCRLPASSAPWRRQDHALRPGWRLRRAVKESGGAAA